MLAKQLHRSLVKSTPPGHSQATRHPRQKTKTKTEAQDDLELCSKPAFLACADWYLQVKSFRLCHCERTSARRLSHLQASIS